MSPSEINHPTKSITKLDPPDFQPPAQSEQGGKVSFLGRSWNFIQNLYARESLGSSLFFKALGTAADSSPSKKQGIDKISPRALDLNEKKLPVIEKRGVPTPFKENAEAAAEQQKNQVAKRNFTIDLALESKAMNIVKVRKQCYKDAHGVVTREFNYAIDSSEKQINSRHVGISSSRGARSHMEDRTLALKEELDGGGVEIYGVFDGHGGVDCAQFAGDHLAEYFTKAMKGKDSTDDESVSSAIRSCFEEIESNFYLGKNLKGGSTAVTAFIIGDDVWIANIGDSRAILVKSDGTAVQATEDAKPEIPKFKKQILLHGGSVLQRPGDIPRVNGQLAVARSLGDSNNFKGVTAHAELTRFPLKDFERGALVVACDGLWDVATTNQVGAAIGVMGSAGWDAKAMSQGLVYHAIGQGSQDNVTVLIVLLKK